MLQGREGSVAADKGCGTDESSVREKRDGHLSVAKMTFRFPPTFAKCAKGKRRCKQGALSEPLFSMEEVQFTLILRHFAVEVRIFWGDKTSQARTQLETIQRVCVSQVVHGGMAGFECVCECV